MSVHAAHPPCLDMVHSARLLKSMYGATELCRHWGFSMAEPTIAQRSPFRFDVTQGKSYWWCACGRSQKQPFCDGSHKGSEFSPSNMTRRRPRRCFSAAASIQAASRSATEPTPSCHDLGRPLPATDSLMHLPSLPPDARGAPSASSPGPWPCLRPPPAPIPKTSPPIPVRSSGRCASSLHDQVRGREPGPVGHPLRGQGRPGPAGRELHIREQRRQAGDRL